MKKSKIWFGVMVVIAIAIIGSAVSLFFSRFVDFGSSKTIMTSAQKTTPIVTVPYDPHMPGDAPADIRDAVMLGYNIMNDTRKYAAEYVGNKLDCDNCHFKGGISEGGKNGGLSLVGVAATYPKFRKKQNNAEDLVTRTNDCFERSMNGRPLPPGGKEMTAIITYFHWISKGLPIYADIPWLGIKLIKSTHKPDPANGRQMFIRECAVCHGSGGQGTLKVPPLWGSNSFNDGAGMHKSETFAAFAWQNMPRSNPDLTAEQALDVAAFVSMQPRPHYVASNK